MNSGNLEASLSVCDDEGRKMGVLARSPQGGDFGDMDEFGDDSRSRQEM